ncbi:hypothetical protein [Levilactobacillus yiduensis]|uniref:hypothetical protein n=1 Tax=Levilactobacillus yiduensis TaxID=2953880 RepID=UPI000EF3194B|nr:hypothetical protein [Levilactobacillus yiduensis]AYM02145.1 hypothetical protein D8911_03745 [Levilactobacillus brevis]
MEKVYSPADAQRNLQSLLQEVKDGKAVRIEDQTTDAILVSEQQWAAVQKQLAAAAQHQTVQQREDLYKAWRWL